MSRKLTPKQIEVFNLLNRYPDGIIRQHIKPTGLVCYRLLDSKLNPLASVNTRVIDGLVDKYVIERSGHDYKLVATI